jgi:4-alpha-glucanotransferase
MAYRWVETLAAMKQRWWQILPLTPTGLGDSPYQTFSAFASEIKLLSPELLEQEGLVSSHFWAGVQLSEQAVDYPQVHAFKLALLREVWKNFQEGRASHLREDFAAYCAREAEWLDDYALFNAIRDALGGLSLPQWPEQLRRRDPQAMAHARHTYADTIGMYQFGQFLFDRQWSALRRYAEERGVRILGDIPIFVALDSADVWAHPELFLLDEQLRPVVVAGVPPDYFSADGQNWGTPIYNWSQLAARGYSWWIARVRRQLTQVDLLRLDHFRGFVQAWHIPAGETTARNGRWVDGPGLALFEALQQALGQLPFFAEDLGYITPDVYQLRDRLGLAGMRVLQFALNGPADLHWPHNFERNCFCYTGTHDNETIVGWYRNLAPHQRDYLEKTVGKRFDDPAWDMIRLAWSSVAVVAIAPLQDLLRLGNEARMNTPSTHHGNWRWRFRLEQFTPDIVERLAEWTYLYNRVVTH